MSGALQTTATLTPEERAALRALLAGDHWQLALDWEVDTGTLERLAAGDAVFVGAVEKVRGRLREHGG